MSLEIFVKLENKGNTGKCSCVSGASGYCHHIKGLLFYMAHCEMFGLASLPDDLTCTSMPQRWSVPREKCIRTKEIQSVLEKGQEWVLTITSSSKVLCTHHLLPTESFARVILVGWTHCP